MLGRGWLGGWALPQERSYFSLRLPQGWWLLALDTALNGDIDAAQLRYFGRVASERMGPEDAAIVVTHAPGWLVEWHIGEKAGANVAALVGCVSFHFVFSFSFFFDRRKKAHLIFFKHCYLPFPPHNTTGGTSPAGPASA